MTGAHTVVAHGAKTLPQVRSASIDRLIGALIVAALPTAFWICVLQAASSVFGWQLTTGALIAIGTATFVLLFCIWASFALARSPSSLETD